MATSYHAAPIVINGLMFCLDASNQKSYIVGATAWNDLSSNMNNLILLNGPSYSTLGVGSIAFDGTDDYGITDMTSFAYGAGDFTWEFWVSADYLGNNHYIIDHDNGGAGNGGVVHHYAGKMAYYNTTTGVVSNLYQIGYGNNFALNTWYHIVTSRISGTTYLYNNGVLTTSDSDAHSYSAQKVLVGNYGGGGYATWYGKISNIRIYKGKGLTSYEVLQNYNALKNRFI